MSIDYDRPAPAQLVAIMIIVDTVHEIEIMAVESRSDGRKLKMIVNRDCEMQQR